MKKFLTNAPLILALIATLSPTAHAQNDNYRAMVTRAANELGPTGYGRCAAATITMSALKARGDNLGRFAPNVDPMVNFMSEVRADLVRRGNSPDVLDRLMTNSSQIIRSASDPILTAMKDFDKCYNDAVR